MIEVKNGYFAWSEEEKDMKENIQNTDEEQSVREEQNQEDDGLRETDSLLDTDEYHEDSPTLQLSNINVNIYKVPINYPKFLVIIFIICD